MSPPSQGRWAESTKKISLRDDDPALRTTVHSQQEKPSGDAQSCWAPRRPQAPAPQPSSPRPEDSRVGKLLLGPSAGLWQRRCRHRRWGDGTARAFPQAPQEPSILPRGRRTAQEINEDRGQTRCFPLCSVPALDSDPGSTLGLERSPRERKDGEWKPATPPSGMELQQPEGYSWVLTRQSRIW